ncbi:hypothetical protein [Verrucosispora sp. NA02020]|uniref:hypothetical protein n=1 Tax=Verrucosispora sp. NA02020 TaxID=2742132 RepID=UPI001591A8AB|nr:hypothetical protein [Verrucosispora sp. NA02020]QKW15355.1 hypothetical protein HUT12_23055 [Verrucosispora sp. NA02020]
MSDYNERALSARWTAVVNDEIGGWAVSIDGRTPADGGVMAADGLTREVAEHIANLHNQWLAIRTATVRPGTAVMRGDRYEVTPLVLPPLDVDQFIERHRQLVAAFDVPAPITRQQMLARLGWDGDVARCTAPDCGRTNQTREETP